MLFMCENDTPFLGSKDNYVTAEDCPFLESKETEEKKKERLQLVVTVDSYDFFPFS